MSGNAVGVILFLVFIIGISMVFTESGKEPNKLCKDGYVLLTRATGGAHVCVPGYIP